MAGRFDRKNKTQGTEEAAEITATQGTEIPAVEEEEEGMFANFLNSGDLAIEDSSAEDNSVSAIADDKEEEKEMAKGVAEVEEVQEVAEAPTAEVPAQSNSAEELKLSEAAKQAIEDANPKAKEMREISSIPISLMHISSGLTGIKALGDVIRKETEEFRAGAGDKDAKVAYAIENMAETDANYSRREAIAALKVQLEELSAKIDEDEAALYEDVEKVLTESGEDIWSDQKIEEKQAYIRDLHSNYTNMYKQITNIMETHNKVKPNDKLGTIDQYVTKVDRPFGRATSGTSSSGGGGATGTRNVFISKAEMSTDGGKSFDMMENSKNQSNASVIATELAKVAKESAAELKDRIYTEYYAAAGHTFETATNENMPEVVTFKVNYQPKGEGSEFKDVTLRMTKRFREATPVATNSSAASE